MTERVPVPRHLSSAARRWWREVVSEYDLTSSDFKLLQAACECWDRLVQARELLDDEGIVTRDRFGQARPHPAVAIERDARTQLARLYAALRLGDDGPALPPGRP